MIKRHFQSSEIISLLVMCHTLALLTKRVNGALVA
jgi:hypothetical protein